MTTIYFTGQNNFGNRGCEALVRSTVSTLREHLGEVHFLVPSLDIPRDKAQWPDASMYGVEFVPSPSLPSLYKNWGRACRLLPFLKSMRWPSLKGLPDLDEHLKRADALISIGGDNYSLDYGLVSLFFFVGIAERALELGKPVALWGASVGPFSEDAQAERLMAKHLNRLSMVSVRESHTKEYLRKIGVEHNVVQVVDSAFALTRQAVNIEDIFPANTENGVLGLNVSPLIESVYRRSGKPGKLTDQVVSFIEHVLNETQLSILLVPHVSPLDGSSANNDYQYLSAILDQVKGAGDRVRGVPLGMNSCQLKDIIANCRFFIGARTHATIAALSCSVPTISIAYSVKARGINLDLFGHERFVLPTPDVNTESLKSSLHTLISEEHEIKSHLAVVLPKWKSSAALSSKIFGDMLQKNLMI